MDIRTDIPGRALAVCGACCAVAVSAAVLGAPRSAQADPACGGAIISLGEEVGRGNGMVAYAVASYEVLGAEPDGSGDAAVDLTVYVPEALADEGGAR